MRTQQGEIQERLAKWLDKKRLKHSLGVSQAAGELAEHYGGDVQKARLAGLVHDCAKCLSYGEMQQRCREYGLSLDDLSMKDRALIHGPLGAEIARRELGVSDREVLDAIACHTTGRKGMTLLDKILCLADYVEPGRTYNGIDTIRRCAYKDLDKALLKGLELSIRHVLDSGSLMHPSTVDARNELIMQMAQRNHDKADKGCCRQG